MLLRMQYKEKNSDSKCRSNARTDGNGGSWLQQVMGSVGVVSVSKQTSIFITLHYIILHIYCAKNVQQT